MKKILEILLISSILMPISIYAQTDTTYPLPTLFADTVNKIATVLFSILVIISVVLFVYGGILFATASGDENKVANARNILLYAVIGLAIALLARALQQFLITNLIQ